MCIQLDVRVNDIGVVHSNKEPCRVSCVYSSMLGLMISGLCILTRNLAVCHVYGYSVIWTSLAISAKGAMHIINYLYQAVNVCGNRFV